MSPQIIRQTRSWLPAITRLIDGIAIFLAAYFSQFASRQPLHWSTNSTAAIAILAFLVCGELLGIYRGVRSTSSEAELTSVSSSWLLSLALTGCVIFFIGTSETYSRSSIILWFLLGAFFLMFARMVIRSLVELAYRRGFGVKRTAIAGTGELAIHVAQNALQFGPSGLKVVGFFDDRNDHRRSNLPENLPEFVGNLKLLVEQAKAGLIDTVLVTLPMRAEKRIQQLLTELGDTTAAVYIVPDFFVFELLHSRWTEFGGVPVVSVFETPIYGVDSWVKRGFDFCIALFSVIMLSPILVACAIAVKCSSPGPIIFRQKRYGLDGREILVWKFRSMRTCDNGPVVIQATKNDLRVTKVGAILRRLSLDELPQLFNVIYGNMSLVGPRPHASAHNEQFRKLIKGYMMRHKVLPGITGMAQVFGSRGETDTIEKMQDRISLDHRYIREWSLWMDVRIIFRTFYVLLRHEAY